MDEELVLLEEQLATAHADIERLQAQLAEARAKQAEHESRLKETLRQLEAARGDLTAAAAANAAREEEVSRLQAQLAAVQDERREAVSRYREAALAREPDVPADLVAGETVAELEASLAQARQTVAQVRQHLEQQAQALRVPAGAPAREGPDVSDLSPAEKIRLGLRQA